MSAGGSEARWIELPRHVDARGSLAVLEDLPFEVRRFYAIWDVPAEALRAGHAHRQDQEILLALSGSFRVLVDDGATRRDLVVDRPDRALWVPALLWHELYGFEPGTVIGVLAALPYRPEDTVADYAEFLRMIRRP